MAGCIGTVEERTDAEHTIYAGEQNSERRASQAGVDYTEPFVETIIVEGTTMFGCGVKEPVLGLIGGGNWVLPFYGDFGIHTGCTGIIATAEGETFEGTTSFEFKIKDSRYNSTAGLFYSHEGNRWQTDGESLPLKIRIPAEELEDYPDGEIFELDVNGYGIEIESKYCITIDVYYGVPLP
ncbi:MAG: hypothetical protein CVT48_03350 [Thermoplasmata archaeon HGW-Thermoplasmata-1]|nr:MAG: hypothetical protein CVT48_03350 [Thermoplasmata archaeon HGW-Thermoplasmata-1]